MQTCKSLLCARQQGQTCRDLLPSCEHGKPRRVFPYYRLRSPLPVCLPLQPRAWQTPARLPLPLSTQDASVRLPSYRLPRARRTLARSRSCRRSVRLPSREHGEPRRFCFLTAARPATPGTLAPAAGLMAIPGALASASTAVYEGNPGTLALVPLTARTAFFGTFALLPPLGTFARPRALRIAAILLPFRRPCSKPWYARPCNRAHGEPR